MSDTSRPAVAVTSNRSAPIQSGPPVTSKGSSPRLRGDRSYANRTSTCRDRLVTVNRPPGLTLYVPDGLPDAFRLTEAASKAPLPADAGAWAPTRGVKRKPPPMPPLSKTAATRNRVSLEQSAEIHLFTAVN